MTIEDAIEEPGTSNTWGSEIHLAAAAMSYRRVIHVLAPGGITTFSADAHGVPIYMVYNGLNYYAATKTL